MLDLARVYLFATLLGAVLVLCSACVGPVGADEADLLEAPKPSQELVHTVVETTVGEGWMLLVHGGAGVISREQMTADREQAYRDALTTALQEGGKVLAKGGEAVDAVEAAVKILEDEPLFNAGRGAVLNSAGEHELDASIMDGRDLDAGAVAGVKTVKNPVTAARAVMERSEHVMFAGEGADNFARAQNVEQTSNDWFTTEERVESLKRVLDKRVEKADKRGTVGAIARDMSGNLAAATSTGGMTGKAPGRTGDSPILGAGNYADNENCAVSATGHGEFFIRLGVARSICARIELAGENPAEAASNVLSDVAELGGDGGVIVLTPDGQAAFVFNTPGMFRGIAKASAPIVTGIYGDRPR